MVEEGGALLALRMLMVKIKNGEGNGEGKSQIERRRTYQLVQSEVGSWLTEGGGKAVNII